MIDVSNDIFSHGIFSHNDYSHTFFLTRILKILKMATLFATR